MTKLIEDDILPDMSDQYDMYREFKLHRTGEDLTKADIDLLRDKDRKQEALRRSAATKGAQGLENAYGQAFQACVKANLVRQIRYKLRAPLYG